MTKKTKTPITDSLVNNIQCFLLSLVYNKTFVSLLIIISLVLGFSLASWIYLLNRVYPAILVADIQISALTKLEAEQKLQQALNPRLDQKLTFNYQAASTSALQTFEINLSDGVQIDINQSVAEALQFGHNKLYSPPLNLAVSVYFNKSFEQRLNEIAQAIGQNPIDANLKVEGNEIIVTPSQDGLVIDKEILKKRISDYLNTNNLPEASLPIKKASPKLTSESALEIKKRLDQIKLSPIKLHFKDQSFSLDLQTILSFIDLEGSQPSLISANILGTSVNISAFRVGSNQLTDTRISLNDGVVDNYLKSIASQIDRDVEEPLFNFDPSSPGRVREFRPPQEGRKLNKAVTKQKIVNALLTQNQTVVDLPVQVVTPQNKLVNELGIKELIGQGVSNFAGSIPNRIYNINLTAQKINGVVVAPGEIFSFVNTVGDITAATGFKQAYVIKSGRTVLDDGGGVCQDSTTLFRAALNAGLPIIKRTAHAYRVGYYEQGFPPGLDATVFYPSVDLQFKNDTPAHILIQAHTAGATLYVDLYGTSDGRVAKVSIPTITNQIPPPPELRQEDPTLAQGVIKQVDFSAWGANVVFTRTVTRTGEVIISDTYRSNYRPWQAIYLVGTKVD